MEKKKVCESCGDVFFTDQPCVVCAECLAAAAVLDQEWHEAAAFDYSMNG